MADISLVAYTWCVYTGRSQINGQWVATIVGTQIVVIAQFGIYRGKYTSHGSITNIISTSVHVVARRVGGRDALGISNITRVLADVRGTGVGVVTLAIIETGRYWWAKIGEVNETSGGDAHIL